MPSLKVMQQNNTIIKEPIEFLFDKYGFDIKNIKKIVFGDAYIAVMLINGSIGVSANLLNIKSINFEDLENPIINKDSHRNILNAYFNAKLNGLQSNLMQTDIFDYVKFSEYKNPVMIGFSKPIYNKLKLENINISVFDYGVKNDFVKNQSKQKECLAKADCVILTATSFMNNTFYNITENTGNNCDVFIFGASALMNNDMLQYKNVKGIFGTVFNKNDKHLLQLVKEGHGQRFTKNHGKKVALIWKSYF